MHSPLFLSGEAEFIILRKAWQATLFDKLKFIWEGEKNACADLLIFIYSSRELLLMGLSSLNHVWRALREFELGQSPFDLELKTWSIYELSNLGKKIQFMAQLPSGSSSFDIYSCGFKNTYSYFELKKQTVSFPSTSIPVAARVGLLSFRTRRNYIFLQRILGEGFTRWI
jgi:hypothetical protein